ncbi:MAG: hypothetical protein Q8O25_07195 [Sulfurisoma sp.]|nr:hypothetical protein [Sulfurisoma sp.]
MRAWPGILAIVAAVTATTAVGADQPVGITATLPHVDVSHEGKPFRIGRTSSSGIAAACSRGRAWA